VSDVDLVKSLKTKNSKIPTLKQPKYSADTVLDQILHKLCKTRYFITFSDDKNTGRKGSNG
jgi:hypothetical protein